MRFKYKEYGDSLRPVIQVNLKNEDKSFSHEVLIDSGSDHCFFDTEVGEAIGIFRENSEIRETFGVGGKVSLYYVHQVTLQIGEKSLCINAGFMPNLGGNIFSYGIVGQKGFFDKFVVKFNLSKELIMLAKRNSQVTVVYSPELKLINNEREVIDALNIIMSDEQVKFYNHKHYLADTKYFFDAYHLNKIGRAKYTDNLIKLIFNK